MKNKIKIKYSKLQYKNKGYLNVKLKQIKTIAWLSYNIEIKSLIDNYCLLNYLKTLKFDLKKELTTI